MSFRRDGEDPRAWQKWVDQHRVILGRCSLPEFVFSDKLTWLRFLEHGGWHPQSGWTVGMLSQHQAGTFYDFIERLYGMNEYRSLLQNLDNARRRSSE